MSPPYEDETVLFTLQMASEAARARAPQARDLLSEAVSATQYLRAMIRQGRRSAPKGWSEALLDLAEAVRLAEPEASIIFAEAAAEALSSGTELHRRALQVLATTLENVGGARLNAGDATGARDPLERASAIVEEIAPGSTDRGPLEDALGHARLRTNDFGRAADAFFIAYQIWAYEGSLPRALKSATWMARAGMQSTTPLDVAGALSAGAAKLRGQGFSEAASIGQLSALDVRLRIAPSEIETGIALDNAAEAFQDAGQFSSAAAMRRQALGIFESVDPMSEDTAVCLSNLAQLEIAMGELAEARGSLVRARKIIEDVRPAAKGVPRAARLAWVWTGMSKIAMVEGNHEVATMWARRAVRLVEQETSDTVDHAFMLAQLGDVLFTSGDEQEALDPLRRAVSILERTDPNGQKLVNAVVSSFLVERRLGHKVAARKLIKRARDLAATADVDRLTRGSILVCLALSSSDNGRLKAALRYGEEAVQLAREARAGPMDLLGGLLVLGQIRLQRGEPDEALAAFEEAIPLAESSRDRSAAPGYQGDVFAGLLGPYRGAIAALFRRGRPEDLRRAYDYSERGRATDLISLISSTSADLPTHSAERARLLAQERALERRIAAVNASLEKSIVDPKEMLLRAQATGDFGTAIRAMIEESVSGPVLEQELHAVRSEMQSHFPSFIETARPRPASITDVQADLGPDVLLVEYMFTDDELAAWAITKDVVHSFSLDAVDTGEVTRDVLRLTLYFRERSKPKAARDPALELSGEQVAALALQVSRKLLGPIPSKMFETTKDMHVVPDGVLHYLPFELLPNPAASGTPLVDAYTVSYAASAGIFRLLHQRRSPSRWNHDVVAYGDVPPPQPGSVAAEAAAARGVVLGPLQESRREVERVVAAFSKALPRYAADATERSVTSETRDARYVLFSTHGLVADGDSLHGGLLLAPPATDEQSSEFDDFLQAFEMFDLNLSAEVVVLSACRTGVGRLQNGEGIRGMAHALFAAGAGSVVLSLWSVSAKASAALVVRLFENLQAGMTVPSALVRAKNYVRSQPGWSDPYYWAAFVSLGATDRASDPVS